MENAGDPVAEHPSLVSLLSNSKTSSKLSLNTLYVLLFQGLASVTEHLNVVKYCLIYNTLSFLPHS